MSKMADELQHLQDELQECVRHTGVLEDSIVELEEKRDTWETRAREAEGELKEQEEELQKLHARVEALEGQLASRPPIYEEAEALLRTLECGLGYERADDPRDVHELFRAIETLRDAMRPSPFVHVPVLSEQRQVH